MRFEPMTKTLILNFKYNITPYTFQISNITFEKFKHYEKIYVKTENKHSLLEKIENYENSVRNKLFASIDKWKTKCHEELAMHDRLENSRKRAKNIFKFS